MRRGKGLCDGDNCDRGEEEGDVEPRKGRIVGKVIGIDETAAADELAEDEDGCVGQVSAGQQQGQEKGTQWHRIENRVG